MLIEQVINYVENLFIEQRESLDAVQKLLIQYSWEGKKYEEMAECISGYSLGYIKTNLAPELWSKLTHILRLSGLINSQEQITKKNVRIVFNTLANLRRFDCCRNIMNTTKGSKLGKNLG
jgi:putative heme degradation protein